MTSVVEMLAKSDFDIRTVLSIGLPFSITSILTDTKSFFGAGLSSNASVGFSEETFVSPALEEGAERLSE